jgi:hypothetical protein
MATHIPKAIYQYVDIELQMSFQYFFQFLKDQDDNFINSYNVLK